MTPSSNTPHPEELPNANSISTSGHLSSGSCPGSLEIFRRAYSGLSAWQVAREVAEDLICIFCLFGLLFGGLVLGSIFQ